MIHQKKGKKFGRKRGQRRAFLKGLIGNLIKIGKITTTEIRAKETRSQTEKLLSLAKKQNVASLRILISRIGKTPAQKLFYEIAPKYLDRKGGYIRIIKLSKKRKGDASQMAVAEFV
ncbi:MAG: 50S ribosomal protein L17 [Candidatus Paceibacterota bacterium]|jgi:large subunit ribosomal protein L17